MYTTNEKMSTLLSNFKMTVENGAIEELNKHITNTCFSQLMSFDANEYEQDNLFSIFVNKLSQRRDCKFTRKYFDMLTTLDTSGNCESAEGNTLFHLITGIKVHTLIPCSEKKKSSFAGRIATERLNKIVCEDELIPTSQVYLSNRAVFDELIKECVAGLEDSPDDLEYVERWKCKVLVTYLVEFEYTKLNIKGMMNRFPRRSPEKKYGDPNYYY